MEVSTITQDICMIKKMETIMIRPATETPHGNFFLSNLDQNMYYYVDVLFTYKANGGKRSDTVHDVLKDALAKVLVEFYPLAGRIAMGSDDKFFVACTGEGVPFVEAYVEDKMKVFGDMSLIHSPMLPELVHPIHGDVLNKPPLTVQVTKFKCGGFVVGVSVCHLLSDGTSLGQFLTCWSETARGLRMTSPPFHDRSIFRPRQPPKIEFPHHEFAKMKGRSIETMAENQLIENPMASWSFCFHPKLVTRMKSVVMNDKSIRPPTNFEFVSALVWHNRTKALKLEPGRKVRFGVAMNMRAKFDGVFPKGYFGNGIAIPRCFCDAGELVQKPISFAIKLIQEAMESVTRNYVQSFIDYFEETRSDFEYEDSCFISKLVRVPLYDADFGYGCPTQVAPALLVYDEIYYLSQGKDSENVVLTLGLPAPSMKLFQELMLAEFRPKSCL